MVLPSSHGLVVSAGAFRLYDVDNDGFITRDEMYNIVDAIYQMVVRIYNIVIHLNVFISCEGLTGGWTSSSSSFIRYIFHISL